MRFKLDENFDQRLIPEIAAQGHDVDTVLDENLSGRSDNDLFEACRDDARALITMDLDFANPLRFPPESTEGILIVRPTRTAFPFIHAALIEAHSLLSSKSIKGKLWIAEPGRVRVYDPSEQGERS